MSPRLAFLTFFLSVGVLFATTANFADSALVTSPCDLKGMQIRSAADKSVNNAEVCEAYQFLISRYTPGPRSSVGLANPKVDGITRLNPDFAVALAKMLKAAPFYIGINSAFRTPAGQGNVNPNSNHTKGCAVDLGYNQWTCATAACVWVNQNGGRFGLHIRMKRSPEWNHIEPVNLGACRTGQPGVGDPVASPVGSPSSDLSNGARNYFNQPAAAPPAPQEQMCALPGGGQVRCSAIANRGGPPPGAQNTPAGSAPQQNLPASQQPNQYLPGQTSVSSQITSSANQSSTSSSAIDLIAALAGPTSASSPSGSAPNEPLILTLSASDARTLASEQTPPSTSTHYGEQFQGQPPLSQQTFTSEDLSRSPVGGQYPPQQLSTWQTVLESMKQMLLRMLAYLRPFGRPVLEQYDELAE